LHQKHHLLFKHVYTNTLFTSMSFKHSAVPVSPAAGRPGTRLRTHRLNNNPMKYPCLHQKDLQLVRELD